MADQAEDPGGGDAIAGRQAVEQRAQPRRALEHAVEAAVAQERGDRGGRAPRRRPRPRRRRSPREREQLVVRVLPQQRGERASTPATRTSVLRSWIAARAMLAPSSCPSSAARRTASARTWPSRGARARARPRARGRVELLELLDREEHLHHGAAVERLLEDRARLGAVHDAVRLDLAPHQGPAHGVEVAAPHEREEGDGGDAEREGVDADPRGLLDERGARRGGGRHGEQDQRAEP